MAFTQNRVNAFFMPCEKSRNLNCRSPPARIWNFINFQIQTGVLNQPIYNCRRSCPLRPRYRREPYRYKNLYCRYMRLTNSVGYKNQWQRRYM